MGWQGGFIRERDLWNILSMADRQGRAPWVPVRFRMFRFPEMGTAYTFPPVYFKRLHPADVGWSFHVHKKPDRKVVGLNDEKTEDICR